MNKLIIAIGVLFTILLTGCAPTYKIEPIMNKNNYKLLIDDYSLDNFYVVDKKERWNGRYSKFKTLSTESNQCTLTFYEIKTFSTKHSISVWKDVEYILNSTGIAYCDMTKINNLKFFECENKTLDTKSYFINQTKDGFKTLQLLYTNKKCFDKIKSHFLKRATIDNLQIKTQKVGNKDFSESAKLYLGTYTSKTKTDNKKECLIKGGNIYLLSSNNDYYGYYVEKLSANKKFNGSKTFISGRSKDNVLYYGSGYKKGTLKLTHDNKISGTIDSEYCTINIKIEEVKSLDKELFKDTFLFFRKYNGYIP